jgi:hypothetical protein
MALFASVVALIACAPHVTLISPYDEVTDKNVTAIHQRVDALLTQLDVDPVPSYASVKPTYDGIRADIAELRLRNVARPNNSTTVKQIDELSATLRTFEDQHKGQTLNQAMIAPSRDAFDRAFGAILKLELTKKELKD